MAKSIFQKAMERSEKIYLWLDDRGWEVPNDPFLGYVEQIAKLKREAIMAQMITLKRYLEEANSTLQGKSQTSSGVDITPTAMDKRRLRTEIRRIELAIADLIALSIKLAEEID